MCYMGMLLTKWGVNMSNSCDSNDLDNIGMYVCMYRQHRSQSPAVAAELSELCRHVGQLVHELGGAAPLLLVVDCP